jgi:hypothetical protein
MVHLLLETVIVGHGVSPRADVLGCNHRRLGLGGLALLAALLGSLLLLHLLVAHGGEAGGDLADLLAVQVLNKLLREVLHEDRVLRLLCVLGEEAGEGLVEFPPLSRVGGLEELHAGKVDGGRGVVGLLDGDGLGSATLVGDADVAEHVLCVGKVTSLLLFTQTRTLLGLGLLLVAALHVLLLLPAHGRQALLFYALAFALVVCLGLGLSLCLRLSGLLLLLALDLAVFGGIPRVENIGIILLVVELATAGGNNRGRGRRGALRVLVIPSSGRHDCGYVCVGVLVLVKCKIGRTESQGGVRFVLLCAAREGKGEVFIRNVCGIAGA